MLGTVATAGTVTGTGVDFTPYFEPSVKAIASIGVISAGTVTVHVQGGTAAGDGSVAYGTIQAIGGAQGTATYELDVAALSARYLRAQVTMSSGGTVTPVGVTFVAKPITT